MNQAGTQFIVLRFPYPWPPARDYLLHGGEEMELIGLADGRLQLTIFPSKTSFTSQPIDTNSIQPRWTIVDFGWVNSAITLCVAGSELMQDSPGVPTLLLPVQAPVPDDLSTEDPNATAKCQQWIQNRKAMFGIPKTPRANRRLKTAEELADDLRNSVLRLKHLKQQISEGDTYLLGTLAGEMRASVYWPKGRDAQPSANYNPLLLRMASLADLPLPVYCVPRGQMPPILDAATMHLVVDPPRVRREFLTDEIRDLQETLIQTSIRVGPSPGKTISALELIKELAHTMGASHYDEDASEFLDVLHNVRLSRGDKATVLMCQIADTLVSLSEWVLSELKTRKLIG
jgi:hypothetical protein